MESDRIAQVYNIGELKGYFEFVLKDMFEYLVQQQKNPPRSQKIESPEKLMQVAREYLQSKHKKNLSGLTHLIFNYSRSLHAPKCVGHQVSVPIPVASLMDSITAFLNQSGAVYEMSPWAAAIERVMVETFGEKIGYERGTFDGLMTHGGSLGNLTAILCARNCATGIWEKGFSGQENLAVLVNGDSHYSILRACGILGIGTQNVFKVEVDSQHRMTRENLEKKWKEVESLGKKVFLVVAASGTTPTGSFDPLNEIADYVHSKGAWLHVDGAHGASVLMSKKHRAKVAGIEKADSVVWDAHKMLYMPSLTTFVFFKNKENVWKTFQQEAPYLFQEEGRAYDGGLKTVECTKRSVALGLWCTMTFYGEQIFEDLINSTFDKTDYFYKKISQAEDFKAYHRPDSNIFCFQYVPKDYKNASVEDLNGLQIKVRKKILETGNYYITQTKLGSDLTLRVTLMNPYTGEKDLDGLIDHIRETYLSLKSSKNTL